MADIAINPVVRRVQFTGNTGVGPFAFTFNILQDADITVYKNTTLLTLTTDYTVSTNANGTGSITLTGSAAGTALVSSDVLTIIGGRELSRTTDFVTAGDLLASSLNEQLDSNVIMTQQVDEKITRSIRQSPGDEDGDMTLPLKSDRADKFLKFDANGNPGVQSSLELTGNIIGANYTADNFTGDGLDTTFTLSNEPGSKNNMQVYVDGVYQQKDTYSLSGSTLTFSEAPPNNSSIEVVSGIAIESSNSATELNFVQPYTTASSRTVQNKLEEVLSVKDFGVVGNGTDETAKIQAAVTVWQQSGGILYFPPGSYRFDSNIEINGATYPDLRSNSYAYKISAYGAELTGTGDLVLDSLKNFTLEGWQARTKSIRVRGLWWSRFVDVGCDELIFGDAAGSDFSSIYWNEFIRCNIGRIYLDTNRGYTNQNSFRNCGVRSRADQGFPNAYDYNIEIYGTLSVQNLNFTDCDLSYASTGVLYVDPAFSRADTRLNFDGCYFDSNLPALGDNVIINHKNTESASGSHYWSYTGEEVSKNAVEMIDFQSHTGNLAASPLSEFVDGTFIGGASLRNDLSYSQITGGTTTYYNTGGVNGGYVNVSVAASTTNFYYAEAPTEGYYTRSFWIRNGNSGTDTVRLNIGGRFNNVTISDTEWTHVQLCPNSNVSAASSFIAFRIFHPDGDAFSVDISNVNVSLGTRALAKPSVDPETVQYMSPVIVQNAGYGTSDGPTAIDLLEINMPATLNDSFTFHGTLVVHVHDRSYRQGGGIIRSAVDVIHRNGGGGTIQLTELSNLVNFDGATPTIALSTSASGEDYTITLTMTSDEGAYQATFALYIDDISQGSSGSYTKPAKTSWASYVTALI